MNMMEWMNGKSSTLWLQAPKQAISSSSKETESSENEPSSNYATSENENDELGWVENKDWCKCGQCKREIQEIGSLCCTEVPAIV